ncbi:MAG: hypothetical protein ACD_2C00211G0006 [uncultured bacterium (gcode 4)]|uniref:Uncharacterized protein n=1 Tax=uncultured bacterium (gcode 4) TaxID=1234023 RepID=K2G4D8_9BACT|nr:MAG: hypothetical protein ACD_2C00211G0006 [uncultured bacterium (gcode 4)]
MTRLLNYCMKPWIACQLIMRYIICYDWCIWKKKENTKNQNSHLRKHLLFQNHKTRKSICHLWKSSQLQTL